MNRRGSTAVWGLIVALVVASGAFAWVQLAPQPALDMVLGPDLTVRHVMVEREPGAEGQTFQRGDRLTHIGGMSVDNLQEFRQLLPPLLKEAGPPEYQNDEGEPEDEEAAVADEQRVVVDYQLLRPVHRFLLALQEETVEPGELPPGVEQGDRLVEVDGRVLPEKMGAEGIRSVAASRPDAVLGIERSDAVFSGQLQVDADGGAPGVLVTFVLVLLVIAVIWRWHSDRIGERAAYCVGLETLCMGWLLMLVFGFQWVLGDPWLAAAVVAGLAMVRPLSMFAREQARGESGAGGTIALGIGALVTAGLVGLMAGGQLASAEEALHAAAIVTGLFIIYELAVGGMEGKSLLDLGDRGGYLAGIVILGLLVCAVLLVLEPVGFREDTWRWFAVLLPGLMWFGDVLYVIKYGTYSAMGEVADRQARRKVIEDYLQEMAAEMPNTDLRLIAMIEGRAMQVRTTKQGLEVRIADSSLADAVEIMITENAAVPLPESTDRTNHPMAGIANALNISLAVVLAPPAGMLQLNMDDLEIALVGIRESVEGDIPSYASSETLDLAQQLWEGPVASAALIEAVSAMPLQGETDGTVEKAPASVRRELDEVQQQLDEVREENQQLAEKRREVGGQLQTVQRRVRLGELTRTAAHPPINAQQRQRLLEGELIEALDYLLDEPDPVVFAGPGGVGKEFTAFQAHLLEGGKEGDFLVVDTVHEGWAGRLDDILGEEGGGVGDELLKGFAGALVLRGAQRCDDRRLLALCHQCDEKSVRLFLAFESEEAEQRSVLEERPRPLQELLEHREVIIPRFQTRPEIMDGVFEFWLDYWTARYDMRVDGFSRMALETLRAYDYPGQIAEAVEVVRLAVLAAEYDVVDREDLPVRVRSGRRT